MESWFPENISSYGESIDGVFFLIYYIVGFWFLLTEFALIYFVIRYRKRPEERAAYVRGERLRELSWILIPGAIVLLLDLGIDVAGARVWEHVKQALPPAQTRVEVTAKQFAWSITYPGPDGEFETGDDLELQSELHVPVGSVVRARLRSQDVIHSFFLPNVRLKQDVVPGREIEVWFDATKPGTYEIACAELCGFGHTRMKGELIVHTPDSYRRWQEENWPPA